MAGRKKKSVKRPARSKDGAGAVAEAAFALAAEPTAVEAETASPKDTRSGYLTDYISGTKVRATPEEVGAVQVFAQRLVEDFGYPKSHIRTRPQYRVRRRPSKGAKGYPVDIAVFSSAKQRDDELIMVVECKKPNEKSGRKQLVDYLTLCSARVGVWFNGDTHLYLRKDYQPTGEVLFSEIPTIPRKGQRLEDIGQYLRKDLRPTLQLKTILRDLRNYLAGHVKGITRDEPLSQQIIHLLLCKVFDETQKGPDEYVEFRAGLNEPASEVRARILDLFARVKTRFDDVFDETDHIELDDDSIAYVVGELQPFCIIEAQRDAIGDAFEVFIGPALRGEKGQFFTPRNVVKMMVEILDPKPEETVLDPACGSGGFLINALLHVWGHVEATGKRKRWSKARIREEQRHVASRYFRGIEKDSFLAKVTKAYMAILGDGRAGVFCENSLLPPDNWDPLCRAGVGLGSFDVILTNPPFGTKIQVTGDSVLKQYTLGHKQKLDKETGRYEWTGKLHPKQPPQLLFIERCLQLLRDGGRMGIVIPESILGMPTYTHIVQFLRERVRIVGVVSMPEELFQPHTHAKTAVLFVQKEQPKKTDKIFMSVVEWCGHDSRGNPTLRRGKDGEPELLDDVPLVAAEFAATAQGFN